MEDVNTEVPVVTDSGVVEAATTTETNVSQVETDAGVQQTGDVTQTATAAPAEQTEEQAVPYERFKTVIDEKNTLKSQVEQLQGHLNLVSGQQPQQVQPKPEQESLTLQVMKQMGVDLDYATPAEMAKVNDRVLQITQQSIVNQNQANQFVMSHPDFAEVVGSTISGQFVLAPPLQRVLAQNQQLQVALQNAGSGANALAYQLAVSDPTYQAELATKNKPVQQVQGETAEQAIKAATGLTSVSAVGGNAVISREEQIRNMSDSEFAAHKQKVMQQGGVSIG